jgi:hypothetical protein
MEEKLRELASKDVRRHYDEVRNVRIAPDYRDETYKHILIPIYATAFTYGNKNYSVLINGQTGKIKGEYPKSPVKIGIIVAIIIAIIVASFAFGRSNNKSTSNDVGYNETSFTYEIIKGDEEVVNYETAYEEVENYEVVNEEIAELLNS